MSRLPLLGGDDGNWGNVLNDYLGVSHNVDGTLKGTAIASSSTVEYVIKGAPGSDITTELLAAVNDHSSSLTTSIKVPAGTYYVTSSINLPNDKGVRLTGAGKNATILVWSTDLGSGTYAIDNVPESGYATVQISDLHILGPNQSAPGGGSNLGYAPAQMMGIHSLDQCSIDECRVEGFYAGIVIDGNHHVTTNVTVSNCYYGMYYKFMDGTGVQDDYFENCDLRGNRFAAIASAFDSPICGVIINCQFGSGPYGFYKEVTPNGSAGKEFVAGCVFIGGDVSSIGNAHFYGPDLGPVIGSSFYGFSGCDSFDSTYALAAQNSPGGMAPAVGPSLTVGGFSNVNVYGSGPGYTSIATDYLSGNVWEISGAAAGYVSGAVSVPNCNTGNNVYQNRVQDGNQTLVLVWADSAVQQFQPVEISHSFGSLYSVKPATGTAPILGIALTSSSANSIVVIGIHGMYTVKGSGSGQWYPLNSQVYYETDGTLATSGGVFLGYAASSNNPNDGTCNVFFTSKLAA